MKGSVQIFTIEKLVDPSVKVSPDEHSTPKIAQISPGPIDSISCQKFDEFSHLYSEAWNTHLHFIAVHPYQPRNFDFFSSTSIENLHPFP